MQSIRHIGLLLIILLLPLLLRAQNDWDAVLDRYDQICTSCIELRERISSGESVPDAKVTELLGELGRLRTLMQNSEGTMSSAQRSRFNGIRSRYETTSKSGNGSESALVSPKAKKNKQIGSKKGQIAPESPSHQTRTPITIPPSVSLPPGVLSPVRSLTETGLSPIRPAAGAETIKIEKYGEPRFDVIPFIETGYRPSYGLWVAASGKHWGGYLSFRSNFTPTRTSYDVNSNGTISTGSKFWGDGSARYGSISVSAGALWRPAARFGIFAGIGYGKRVLAWKDLGGEWAKVTDFSWSGIGAETGITFTFKHIDIMAGACWMGRFSFLAGIGYAF